MWVRGVDQSDTVSAHSEEGGITKHQLPGQTHDDVKADTCNYIDSNQADDKIPVGTPPRGKNQQNGKQEGIKAICSNLYRKRW